MKIYVYWNCFQTFLVVINQLVRNRSSNANRRDNYHLTQM